ncbi:MAG: efflux RND transporter permease subunit, partial [Pseudobdellovibrio sp.]
FLKGNLTEHKDTKLVQWLKNKDRSLLNWALSHHKIVIGSTLMLLFFALALIPFMGRDFLPKFNEGTAMITLIAPPGTSLAESNKLGLEAESILMNTPEIKSVSRRTGRAELDEHASGVNVSEIDVDFKNTKELPNARNRDIVLDEIRKTLKKRFPSIGINVGQPISHLIDHMLSGVNAALAIKIFGPDLTTLTEKAVELETLIKNTPGLVDLKIEQQGLIPQIKIHVLREEAAKYGLSAGEITKLLEGAFNGEVVAQINEDNRLYDVFFQFDANSRSTMEKMMSTVIKIMPSGQKVFVQDVADVYEASGPNEINRENSQRRIVISGNVSQRDLGSLVKEIQTKIASDLKLPEGYYIVYGGQFESQQSATKNILMFGIISILGIAAVLFSHFKSRTIMLQIMSTIPLAFIGGIILLFVTDRSITVASLVGFITLCGVASRNGIMMVSHYLHIMKYEGETFSKEMIIRGSQERLVPVMMTAFVASLALLPLVFAKGQPGSEVLHPVAVVIVGGLITSTLLDILITPTLFYKYGKQAAHDYIQEKNKTEQLQ